MIEFKRVSFGLLCYEKKEKIALTHNNGSYVDEILFDYKHLGHGLCNIVNHKSQIIQLKKDLIEHIEKYLPHKSIKDNINTISIRVDDILYSNIKDNIQFIFNELNKISPYFIFAQNDFIKCMADIIEEFRNGNINNVNEIYKYHLNKTLKGVIATINLAIAYEKNKVNGFHVPSARVTCNINKEKNFSIRYSYVIDTLEHFITVSYYQLKLNKLYFMQCAYPNCNKYFVASRGQERFCTNPCPDNPDKTCRSIDRRHKNNDDNWENWEDRLAVLESLYNKLKERFRYEKEKCSNNREKEKIYNNREKFKEYVQDLKRLIRGATIEEKRNQYLKIYEEFLNEVEEQIKTSKKFIIKKPSYKN